MIAMLLAASSLLAGLPSQLCADHTYPQHEIPAAPIERIGRLSTEMRYELRGIHSVLAPAELDELLSQRHDFSMRRWIEEYWKLKDPIYTTEENEVLLEHNRRVAFAESAFAIRKWPMWDQRGEMYIRYGPPAYRHIIPPDANPSAISPPGELWYYPQYELYVMFEDVFSRGDYTYYLERMKGTPGIRMDRIADEIDAVSQNLGAIPPPSISHDAELEAYRKMFNKLTDVIKTTPSSYFFDFAGNRMPFVCSIDRFRGGERIDRVDFNIEFRANVSSAGTGRWTSDYVATAVVWDTNRKEVARKAQRLTIPLAEGTADSSRLIPVQLVVSMPPGFYFTAVTLQEVHSGRITSVRKGLACEDFDSKLAMSDVLLASMIKPASRESSFNRGPLLVIPHPLCHYRTPASVPIYLEIYNLAVDVQGLSSYDVEYRIISGTSRNVGFLDRIRGKKPSLDVSSSFHTSNPGSSDQVYMTLATDNLWPGTFTLLVKITDKLADAETSRQRDFEILQ